MLFLANLKLLFFYIPLYFKCGLFFLKFPGTFEEYPVLFVDVDGVYCQEAIVGIGYDLCRLTYPAA